MRSAVNLTGFGDVDDDVVPLLRQALAHRAAHLHAGSGAHLGVADLNLERTAGKLGSVLRHVDHVHALLLRLEAAETCEKTSLRSVRLAEHAGIP